MCVCLSVCLSVDKLPTLYPECLPFYYLLRHEARELLQVQDMGTTSFSVLPFPAPPRPAPSWQDQRGELIAEKRDKAAQVAEMKQGLRRLRLAGRLGVAARELAQGNIEVPSEAIGRVSCESFASQASTEVVLNGGQVQV